MIRVRPAPLSVLPVSPRARLLGISSLTALAGAVATAPRPTLSALANEIERLDPK